MTTVSIPPEPDEAAGKPDEGHGAGYANADGAESPHRPLPYRPALDGLRAVAVIAVLLFHGGAAVTPGGFLGVDLFFVLSGFLITSLLLTEWQTTGTVSLRSFWSRRARRLLPALLLVVAAVAVYTVVAATAGEAGRFRRDALATLFYVGNWNFVGDELSYFEQAGRPPMLRHTWSLGIEEQFYLLWPLVILAGMKVFRLKITGWIVAITGGIWVSVLLMAALFDAEDINRAYYGTDTRLQGVLVGALAAFVLQKVDLGRVSHWSLTAIGSTGLLVLMVMITLVHESDGWMYRGGYLLASLAGCAAVVAASGPPDTWFSYILGWPPLVAIGQISYGLYLWHWPIYIVLDPERVGFDGLPLLIVRLAVTGVVAFLSFVLVEQPIRHGALKSPNARLGAVALSACMVTLLVAASTQIDRLPESIETITDEEAMEFTESGQRPGQAADPNLAPPGTDDGVLDVLLVGDSIAFSLGYYGDSAATAGGLRVTTGAVIGCGVARGVLTTEEGGRAPLTGRCDTWPDLWADKVAEARPDVSVILIGAWEIFDHEVDGKLLEVGTDEYEEYLRSELQTGVDILSAGGSPVVLLTAPCFARSGKEGSNWKERGEAERVDWVNEVILRFAEDHPDQVTVADLHEKVCPSGTYQEKVDGIDLHNDGAHYNATSAPVFWNWLAPILEDVVAQGPNG